MTMMPSITQIANRAMKPIAAGTLNGVRAATNLVGKEDGAERGCHREGGNQPADSRARAPPAIDGSRRRPPPKAEHHRDHWQPVLKNAIRHTPLGAHIAVTADPVGSIVVEDDGPGLRDDLVPDLLQPFKKGAAWSEGAGLGLAIVKQRSPTWHLEDRPIGLWGAKFQLTLPAIVARPASRSGFEPPERGGCVA
jgi:hypothetical protein